MNGKISNLAQVVSLRRYTLHDGPEDGLDVIDCTNGKLRFLVNVSKACDIMQVYHGGDNLSFVSKNGFCKRDLPFLNRFEGGMLYTCGLDSVGGREGFELHGTLHNTPARIRSAIADEHGVFIEAEIRSTALFGKNLSLIRTIASPFGSDTLQICDTLRNEGCADEEYALLYHVNLGYPMLDRGARLEGEIGDCLARTEWAAKHADRVRTVGDPIPCQDEFCYFLKMNKPAISLVNPTLGKRFSLTYSQDTLPCFVLWKSMASGDYALGLEPSTTELDGRFAYRTLKPDERIDLLLTLSVTDERA